MNMKSDIFEKNDCPFTVPDGYFDTLQERIMSRIRTEENCREAQGRTIRMSLYRKMVAAAACVLFIFAGATLYMTYSEKQSIVAEIETVVDEDFYRWLYTSDRLTQMAETLDILMPENFLTCEAGFSEEDKAIIQFLERGNINVAAILYSIDNEIYSYN